MQVCAIKAGAVRVTIDERKPIRPRFRVPDVLTGEPVYERMRVEKKDKKNAVTLTWGTGQYQIRIQAHPLLLQVFCDGEVTASLNEQGRLFFETVKDPPKQSDGEPYRLYNLDVFGYSIHSPLGLYGSVPFLLAHSPDRTVGAFWLNASETLLDVQYDCKKGPAPPKANRREVLPHTNLRWMSESGVIDSFILLGPSPSHTFLQYAELTGYQALPPLFSLGYHQCRWSYDDEADVKAVDAGFDRHAIPYDVIWLDIEHTRQNRYFTWDSQLFPDPVGLQRHLQERERKLVVISDPHIKVDPSWELYSEAQDRGYFVRDREGKLYNGRCWPGESCYLDFTSPEVRAWYSSLFALDKYKGSTDSLHVWNDMNEPSVFGGPEQTMPKDAVHHGGVEHRELHNLYGFYQHLATVEGLISRSGGLERPFVLSRSFFAGSQRLGAVWTGDNLATWEYLKISIPMLLSLSIVGVAFCGADVGGFFQDPKPELLIRWYQAGSLQPFFRGHSAKMMKRREPWLFGDTVTAAIRNAVQQRYCLLPYWYTLFHQAHTSAKPPIRPLWVEFSKEQDTFTVEHEYMIGSALLACPVTDPGATKVKVLLPGSEGYLYLDDGHSFNYRDKKHFTLRRFSLQKGHLKCCCTDNTGQFDSGCLVQSVTFLGVKKKPSAVTTLLSEVEEICCTVQYQEDQHLLMVGNLSLPVGKDWDMWIR
ncbi:neutral alpha-glucosidase C-like [Scleropages formosus]|uniref:Neutral alpha-glucosidase C-like n=1 Tax=Scleropages formosus TaxID=113540 RepID=A0A0P7UHW9_SCLFO|nr:neutral alpha-glucosidase C-like [Scleropages formosus]